MSELAYNMNGEPFEVPATATGWRVRRMKHKGAPEVVYSRDGVPLVLPIDAGIDDLREAVGQAGRYRVDPVDEYRPIHGASAGYVFIHDGEAPVVLSAPEPISLPAASDNVVIEAMRMNSEIAKSVVERFPQMLEAAAILVRAADGAGLPARTPSGPISSQEEEADVTEAPAPTPGLDFLNSLVAQIVPVVMQGIVGKKLPPLDTVLDWRKATPKHQAAPKKVLDSTVPPDPTPLTPAQLAHFLAIQNALEPNEAALARQLASELSPVELRGWFDDLGELAVADAVAKIRAMLPSQDGAA